MSEQREIGSLVDSRGVTAELDDDDLVTDVLVLLKLVKDDGEIALAIAHSDGMDYINQLGLMAAASAIINAGVVEADDDE